MEEKTLAAPGVAALLARRFVLVRLDPEAQASVYDQLVGGRGALASAVLDETGDPISMLPGYAEADPYARFLERALAGYPGLRTARAAAARWPRDPERLLTLAQAYEDLGHPRRSEEVFLRVTHLARRVQTPPPALARAGATAHERLARSFVARGRNLEARQHLEAYHRLEAVGRTGRLHTALLTEALVLVLERRMTQARAQLEDLLLRFPQMPERDHALLALGTCEHELKEDARAIATFEELLRAFPSSRFAAAARQQIDHVGNPVPEHEH
jgi:tetratricopeptide (TPR) repeat protein